MLDKDNDEIDDGISPFMIFEPKSAGIYNRLIGKNPFANFPASVFPPPLDDQKAHTTNNGFDFSSKRTNNAFKDF